MRRAFGGVLVGALAYELGVVGIRSANPLLVKRKG